VISLVVVEYVVVFCVCSVLQTIDLVFRDLVSVVMWEVNVVNVVAWELLLARSVYL